jgi:hypothetical protein
MHYLAILIYGPVVELSLESRSGHAVGYKQAVRLTDTGKADR